jgi:hypothetical protein
MVQRLQVQDGSLIVLNSEIANVQFFSCAGDIRQKLAVGARAIGAEFVQDFG